MDEKGEAWVCSGQEDTCGERGTTPSHCGTEEEVGWREGGCAERSIPDSHSSNDSQEGSRDPSEVKEWTGVHREEDSSSSPHTWEQRFQPEKTSGRLLLTRIHWLHSCFHLFEQNGRPRMVMPQQQGGTELQGERGESC